MKDTPNTSTISSVLREDSDSVYVINKTGDDVAKRSEGGLIHLSISPGNNEQPISVIVPHTWAPFDLSTQMSKEMLLSSYQFRRAIGSKMMLLVAAKDAETYLRNNKDAADENSRANQSLFGIEQSLELIDNRRNSEKTAKVIERLERSNDKFNATQIDVDPETSGKDIDLSLLEIVERHIIQKDVTETEMYNTIRLIDNKRSNGLTADEKEYVTNNVKFDKVLKFVQDSTVR